MQLETGAAVWLHMTWRSTDNNVSLVQSGTCSLWHNDAAKHTHMILTIRLPRYFSTSDKLRTDTLALGIIIPCLWSVTSWWFFNSGPGLVYNSRQLSDPCLTPFLSPSLSLSFSLTHTHTLPHTHTHTHALTALFNIQKLCVNPNSASFSLQGGRARRG